MKKQLTEDQKKQLAYSKARGRHFEKVNGRKMLSKKEQKKGRPR